MIIKELPDSETVEVVAEKKMTYGDYKRFVKSSKRGGWKVRAYQPGFRNKSLEEL